MALTHAILTALLDDDLTGYQLAKEFDVSLGFFWSASHQQIYQSLKRLSSDAFIEAREVTQTGKPDKRIYSLTQLGRDHLDSWVLGETKKRRTTDELFVKLYNLGHSSTAPIVEAVEQRQHSHREKLMLYRKIQARNYAEPSELPNHKKGIYLALLAGIHQEQSSLAWCDEALVLLATVD
jgi:DNA-binding PadR family transcriptional regulator